MYNVKIKPEFTILYIFAFLLGSYGLYLRAFSHIHEMLFARFPFDKSYIEHIIGGFAMPSILLLCIPKSLGITFSIKTYLIIFSCYIFACFMWEMSQFLSLYSSFIAYLLPYQPAQPGTFQYLQFFCDITGALLWLVVVLLTNNFGCITKLQK